MNCANHPDVPVAGYCRTCGKALCSSCAREVRGVVYCEECLAAHLSGSVPPVNNVVPPPGATVVPPAVGPQAGTGSPVLAAILGCIPGVGAMYNGEFAKGFVHVLIFATLIWLTDHVNGGFAAIFGIAIGAFYIYMPIEAYKTARARQMGLPAPDPFGFNSMFASPQSVTNGPVPPANPGDAALVQPVETRRSNVPMGAIILIGLGVLFLLGELDLLHFDRIIERFWPLVLIALGIRVLMQRQRRGY